MRNITTRELMFSYHNADIPYYRENPSYRADVSYVRYDNGRMKLFIAPTNASLARLARLPYAITIDSGYAPDRWYLHGVRDLVFFDFMPEEESQNA